MKTILITGFAPFGGEHINPSWEAVRLLAPQIGGWQLHKLLLPVVFGCAAEQVLAEAAALQPDVILCIGQAGGRDAVTPEKLAVNLRDARIPDNAGNLPVDEPVVPGGPAAYFSTLPARQMAEAVCAAGLPGRMSCSAGAFVCNDLLYTLLHRCHGTAVRIGFIHVPYLPQQAKDGAASLPLEDIVRALTAAIESLPL